MDRIKKLCSYLSPCESFADIGCDHGYCSEYMLKNGLCEKVTISDVSEKSLSKAERLLKKYIESGICTAVCCDGLTSIDKNTDLVLIAGIGGEEIVKILKESFIPESFVFQPMHSEADLRKYLLNNDCKLTYDGIFYSGNKYYFVIKGENSGGEQNYTPAELAYGRDSLGSPELKSMLKGEIEKAEEYLSRSMSQENRQKLTDRVIFLRGILNGEIT
ncbi:MAG: class I SAM-dependent methyltransferase [Clostridia bacterium]|nr:class I SAM-dependent methyltransferase [Clostridia bacterium]